jgi:hypothetical protein
MKRKKQVLKTTDKSAYEVKDLRMTKAEWEEVDAAAKADAESLGIRYSRNNYCVRAVLAAVRKPK